MVALIIVGIIAVAVGGILIYRNNQKKIEADAAKVSSTIKKVETTTQAVVNDVKKA
jgi:hypothetical protein